MSHDGPESQSASRPGSPYPAPPAPAPRSAREIELAGVSKRFGAVTAVRPLDLSVRSGEFLTLLGPSGCGKTTVLRMVAGLEAVSTGTIRIGGSDVTSLHPRRRDLSIMFQDYALFPHMSLVENVSYGLKMRGVARPARHAEAERWLDRMGLSGLGARRPEALSGGQRQRVALARALITDPGALLLDEPLSALDANLRTQLRGELRRIHREVGTTFVCVTHDQEEAMTLSDRIAVLRDGLLEQLGPPALLYDAPSSAFVARFFGRCDLWPGVVAAGPEARCHLDGADMSVGLRHAAPAGSRVLVVARPEQLALIGSGSAASGAPEGLPGRIAEVIVKGPSAEVSVALHNGCRAHVELPRDGAALPQEGAEVRVRVAAAALSAVPADE